MSNRDLDDYIFGISVSSKESTSNIPPILHRESYDSLHEERHDQRQSYDNFSLTKDRLEKKDKLDSLVYDGFTHGESLIGCSQSISNGDIERQLYHDEANPPAPYNKLLSSESSITSTISPNSNHSNSLHSEEFRKYRLNNNADSLSGNIESVDNSVGHRTETSFTPNKQYSSAQKSSSRKYSQLVRLSANYIATCKSRKNKKKRHRSYIYLVFLKLSAIASRVVETRTSEPADTRMSVNELVSLSNYLHALKYGDDNDDASTSSFISEPTSLGAEHNTIARHVCSAIEELENVSAFDVHFTNKANKTVAKNIISRITENTPANNKRHISSLGNVFPFESIERISTSESERNDSMEPSEYDHLLSSHTSMPNYCFSEPSIVTPKKKFFKEWMTSQFRCIKHNILDPILSKNYQQLHVDTQIRFGGWSLFLFSPTSLTRFFLWRIIGSRRFELFIFFLLFTQWIILSFIPIRFNNNQPFFSRYADYILLIINIVYTLEAISKIIVYGLLFSTHSTSKPTLYTWIRYFRQLKVYHMHQNEDDDISEVTSDDNISTYDDSLRQNNIPAFASARSISSNNNSLPNAFIPSVDSGKFKQNSSHSASSWSKPVDESLPPWASTSTNNLNKYKSYVQNDDEEENKSILIMAERKVRASISYSGFHTANSEYDEEIGEFLKVDHQPYLMSVANVVDFVSIISYWIDVIALLFYNKRPWSIFQAMAAMRLFRFLVITEGTTVIMNSLRSSYDMLKNVFGFFVFFWLLFSLVALFIFMNAFSRRCAVIPAGQLLATNMTNIAYVEPRISCSGYMISGDETTGAFDINTGYQYSNPGGDGLYCKVGQICIQDSANQPGYGYISFENIFFAMLNILTVISTEDWTDLLYISQDSVSEVSAALFYSFCIYLMSFIMVPMFIAVITTSFAHARGDMRDSAFSLQRKSKLILTDNKTKSQGRASAENADDSEIDDGDEWIYGLGQRNIFQKRSIFHCWAYYLVQKTWFPYIGHILVAANMVSMIFYNPKNTSSLSEIDRFFTITFFLEIMLRIIGCSNWRSFWKNQRNRFDLIIAAATVLDEISYIKESRYHIHLLIFRVIRSYRIAYLFPGVLNLASDVLGDGQGLRNLTFFTFLVLFLLAPISVQLFGGDFDFVDNDEPSMRFDNSYQAFLALFQIMTGENWTDILFDAMHSQEHDSVTYAALFMVFLYFIVHYIVLNLFIAVIMENFDLDEDEIKQLQIKKYIREHRWRPEYFKMDKISRFLLPLFVTQEKKLLDFKNIPQDLVAHVSKTNFYEFLSEETLQPRHYQDHSSGTKIRNIFPFLRRNNTPDPRPPSVISFKSGHSRSNSLASHYSGKSLHFDSLPVPLEASTLGSEAVGKYNDEYEHNVAKENTAVIMENLSKFRSLAFLRRDHFLRKFCISISNSTKYNQFLILTICTSALLATWADEFNRKNYPNLNFQVIESIQNMILAFACIDMLIHVIAEGVLMLPKSYMRNVWNLFDILNLIAQIVFTIFKLVGYKSGLSMEHDSYLRILRAFRSIRIVYYVQGMRVIFLDVVYGFPKMLDAVALNLLVFITFAIYGFYLFGGRFALCNDESASSIKDCYGEFLGSDDDNNDILLPRVWRNPYDYSFDTFWESLLHLFECASGEGWILSLFSAMSVPENYGEQPKFNWGSQSTFNSLFYVVFMFVASLCSIQLFIGVFLEIFKQRSGISSLTNTQQQFQDLQRQLAMVKPILKINRPENCTRGLFYDLIIDKRGVFTRFMTIVLTLNIAIFATEHSHQPLWLTHSQNMLNSIFLFLYAFEVGAKIIGLGLMKWATILWNVYDFLLVGMTIGTSVPRIFMELPFEWNLARKIFLVGIAFRLAQRYESLNNLFRSVKRALPSIFYVSTVFGIVITCFGVTFQEHFSRTKFGPYGNEHANFRTLPNSILTLFRITTGENWDFLMHDFAVRIPECAGAEDCGSPVYAFGLFIIFYVLCTFIFVNLFTVIVIDNFSFTFDKRNQFTLITRTDLRKFKEAWAIVDTQATGYININDVPKFLRQLDGVLSLRIYDKEHSISAILDASNSIGNDFRHSISFPLSYRLMTQNFVGNNMQQRERYFNFYEVNRCLSNINANVIQERKKEYTLIYQEIVDSATYRGVAFQKMLEILAMRLVDVSKSLTFDELVNRARVQDRIHKELAFEKAKGLVAMIVQRREYIKSLQKSKHNDRKMSGYRKKNWLSPHLPFTGSNDFSPIIQLRKPESKSLSKIDNNDNAEVTERSSEKVPTIVINEYQQNLKSVMSSVLHNPLPENNDIGNHDGASAALISLDESSNKKLSNNNQNTTNISPSLFKRNLYELITSHSSLASGFISSNDPKNSNNEGSNHLNSQNLNNYDVFTQYYTNEITIDNMTSSDTEVILNEFNNSIWSEMLNSKADDDSNDEYS